MSRSIYLLLIGLFFTLSFSLTATAALIPTIADYFGISPLLAGRLVWFYMLPYGLCALIWAPLSRVYTSKRLIVVSLFLFSCSALVVSLSSHIQIAFLGRIGMGIFGSAFVPLSLIIIGKEVEGKKKGKYIGFLFSLSFFFALLGVFLSGVLFWRLIYLIPALSGFSLTIISKLYLKGLDYRGEFKISYLHTFREKGICRLFIAIIFVSMFYHSVQQWLGVYLAKKLLLSQMLVSFAFTVSSLSAIFSENIGGFLSARFSSLSVASWGIIIMSIFLFSLIGVGSKRAIFLIMVLWGMGWALSHVGFSAFITTLPDRFLRDVSSLNSSLRFFAGGIGAYLGGKSIVLWDFYFHFIIVGIILLIIGSILRKFLGFEGG